MITYIKLCEIGMLSQATKNKTYTPKNICSVEVRIVPTKNIQPSFMLREQGQRGFEYNEKKF